MVGKAVCSDVCPCSGALFADWKVNDVQARNYSRTLVQTPAEKNEQVKLGLSAPFVLLKSD